MAVATRLTFLAVLLSGAPLVTSPIRATRDEREILAVTQRLFDAMRAKDTAGVRAVFDSGARLVGMRPRANAEAYMQSLSVSEFVGLLGRDPRPMWTERAWNPEVRTNGTLATVWAEYDFHFGATFSHCGIDAVQLLKRSDGWKIVSIADTFTREGCTSHPPPKT
jgi:hypothetical protein